MHTYDTREVKQNSLKEINFTQQGHRSARATNVAEYSVAILWLVANSTSLFPWTRELLRRHPKEDQENVLRRESDTFDNLLSFGRSLVYYFRHGEGVKRGPVSLLDISRIEHSWKFHFFTFRCPSLLAVLLSCCFKTRLSITMGVQDIFASPMRMCSTAFISCTHGHGGSNQNVQLVLSLIHI